jgi:hypothetical protein
VVLTHEAPAPVTDAEPDMDQASQTASE